MKPTKIPRNQNINYIIKKIKNVSALSGEKISNEIKAASCAYYRSNTEARKAAYSRKAKAVIKKARQYYAKNRAYICANQRRKYELAEPKRLTKMFYVHKIKKNLMCNTRLLSKLIGTFEKEHTSASSKISKGNRKTAISNLAAQRVVCKTIQVRKRYVGALLKAVRYINALKIKEMADFGEGLHSAHSEPYFYDSAYLFVKRPDILTIDQISHIHGNVVQSANLSLSQK